MARLFFEKEHDECADCDPYDIFKQVSARKIFWIFSLKFELDKIRFIGQAATLNRALSNEGLREITAYTLAERYANKLVVV